MSDTYAAVDDSGHVAEAIDWQERIDQWPAIAAYKTVIDGLVGNAGPILDVGTGPGLDAARTGAVGVDVSFAMARRAHDRNVPVAVADANRLPLADGAIGALRADRVLQHLAEPDVAIAEWHRVLRPGGRMVVADPDQGTLTISVPGVPDRITEAVRRLRRDVGYRNGRIASEMPGRLAALGMTDVRVDASALVLTDPDLAFGLPGWVEHWRDRAGFTTDDVDRWRSALADSSGKGFVYTVTYLVSSAVKA